MEQRQQHTKEDLEAEVEKAAKSLRRQELFLALVSLVVGAGYLVAMILWGSVRLRDGVGSETSSQWIVVLWYILFFTLAYDVIHFPVSFLRGYVVEKRFRLSKQRFRRWLWAEVKKYIVSALFIVFLGELLYVFLRRCEGTWWFWAWLAYLVVGLVLKRYGARVILPVFYKREDLDDKVLEDRLKALVERAGFQAGSIKRIILAKDTHRANAAVTGLGHSKEILVSDTLIGNLSNDEIEGVVAHELAHAKNFHGEILLVIAALVSFIAFVLAAGILNLSSKALGIERISDVAGFPLIVLVFAGLYLVLSPFVNGLSREMERAADLWAARFTGAPQALATALEKIAATNLVQRTQPRYYEILFASHPSIARRVAYLKRAAADMASPR